MTEPGRAQERRPAVWAIFVLLTALSLGLLLAMVWGVLRIVSPLAPTTQQEVTVIGTSFESSRTPGPSGSTSRLVYEVIGVTEDDKSFRIASRELYDHVDGRVPVSGIGEVVTLTGEVVRVEVEGVEGGGRTGTSLAALVATVMIAAVLGVLVYAVISSDLSTSAYLAAMAVGAMVAVVVAYGWAQESDATAEQLRARDLGIPFVESGGTGDSDLDIDIEVPELEIESPDGDS